MPNFGPTELLIIAGVLLLFFGATKLPKLARSVGQSARIFRTETDSIRDDDKAEDSSSAKDSEATGSESRSETRQLPEPTQKKPLVAETVEDHQTDHKKAR